MYLSFFKNIVDTLYNSNDDFILEITDKALNKDFIINFKNDLILLKCKGEIEYETVFNDLEKFPKFLRPNVKEITHIVKTKNGKVREIKKVVFYSELDVLHFILSLMKENAVFLIQNKEFRRVCFYINARVFFVNEQEGVLEVVDNSFFRLPYMLDKFNVCLVSPLKEKQTCGLFVDKQAKVAKSRNYEFRRVRDGIGVR